MEHRAAWFGGGVLLLALLVRPFVVGQHEPISGSEVRDGKLLARSEALIHQLEPKLGSLALGLREGILGAGDCSDLFGDSLLVTDVLPTPGESKVIDALGVTIRQWPLGSPGSFDPGQDSIWSVFLHRVSVIEYLDLHVASASFGAGDATQWKAVLEVEALGADLNGGAVALRAVIDTRWSLEAERFQVREWNTVEFETLEVETPLFEEVLDELLEPDVLARARRSVHEERVLAAIESGKRPKGRLEYEAFDRHPGISVVDIDSDGFDDLYVMARHGPNLLLRNRGDGTLDEVSESWGLDIDSHCSAAVFADFDNDGDPDLFLGRTLEASMLLENTGSEFVDVSAQSFEGRLPALVSSVNAVDYDGDGLLDLYVSTYAASMVERAREWLEREGWSGRPVLEGYLGAEQAAELGRRLFDEDFHFYLERPGPENVLLHNEGGGRFVPDARAAELFVDRNTYQSAWGDYDGDGDPDVYLANDFSPNHLFRNDGDGQFVDVTTATATADYGFGMGVSWGDYDNDGLLDLYISNMHSRAGSRIVEATENVDSRVAKAAAGNSLLRNQGGRFQRESGLEGAAHAVARAGWSWGGQFADLNNDGLRDLYVLSGYYTAPERVGLPFDC